MRVMRRVLVVSLAAFALFLASLALSALRLPSRQIVAAPPPPRAVAAEEVAEHLAASLRFPTISHSTDPADLEAEAFAAFRGWFEATYPKLHRTLVREIVAGDSLLYTWQGTDPSLEPIVLAAHQDVVPAENLERWTRPPFEGRIEDGFVWGRGTIDDKGPLVAIAEAVERLIGEGFAPRRSVLLAFGHDEEVGGQRGAKAMAELLASRGVRALLVLDEGAAVVQGVLPGFARPVALVGVAEKGSATLEVVARADGGHSSTPPRETASGILARAIGRIESNPLPGGVVGVTRQLFEYLAPETPLYARIPLANLWLFARPMDWVLSREPGVNALLRTTTAVTMLSGSPKDNVLPVEAIAGVNFRLLPGDTSEWLLERITEIVDDPRVEVRFKYPPREASPVSPIDGPAFALLQTTVAESFPDAIFAPFLTVGGTDCRHYAPISDGLYRFAPFTYGAADLKLPHGIDERIAVDALPGAVRFYARFIENASAP
jgi:carboxypeptidase PM20D1